MKLPRISRRARLLTLGLALVLIALEGLWVFDSPPGGRETTPSSPSVQAVAPTKTPSSYSPQRAPRQTSAVPARYVHTDSPDDSGPQPMRAATPAPIPSPSGSWSGIPPTNCHRDSEGRLACSGPRGSFTCRTGSTGTSRCTGENVSFSCATDTQTGARECDGSSGTWQCITSAETESTGCTGDPGSYSCRSIPGEKADVQCTGSSSFQCYDYADGRNCGRNTPTSPDCFFEPIFGVYCRR